MLSHRLNYQDVCTRGGTRTPTSFKILDPKSSASTNSATLAVAWLSKFQSHESYGFFILISTTIALGEFPINQHVHDEHY